MSFINRYGFVLFAIVAITDIIFLSLEYNAYRYYTKPLLAPILLLNILSRSSSQPHPASKRIVSVALIAATVADVFLLGTGVHPEYLTYGLYAFLVMQLLYALYFFRMHFVSNENVVVTIFIALLIAGFAFTFVGTLYRFMGNMQTPVTVYAVAASVMVFAAINVFNSKRAQKLAAQFFVPGAVMLIMSHGVLAVNTFYLKDNTYDLSVLITYILGQLFLSIGFIKHLKSSGSKRKKSSRRRRPGSSVAEPNI